MNKSLDYAIMLHETADNHSVQPGYQIQGRTYNNYLSNESWKIFKEEMERRNPVAYEMYAAGGGKELEERKSGPYMYPPKMASFGSSSRMIYNMMKNTSGFLFEKKLSTTIGGIANLDGFLETDRKCVFVEAKCREPYVEKSAEIDIKYRALYQTLKSLSCTVQTVNGKKMQVAFSADGIAIHHFDIKQMICHLLGVATAYLKGVYNKQIEFIYLLYNPTKLDIRNRNHKEAVCRIYQNTVQECACVDFKELFYEILCYLQQEENLGLEKDASAIADKFSFRMCDQFNMNV